MKFHILCFLALCAAETQGFIATKASISERNSLLIRNSATASSVRLENSWKDVTEFNIALDKVAEQCGSLRQPVVSRAAECQEMWEKQQNSDSIQPDTISFNTVLKAWNRCCNTLSESTRSQKMLPTDYKHQVDVYTARDAAKRATALLLNQEELSTDAASYNIVIGKKHVHPTNPHYCFIV